MSGKNAEEGQNPTSLKSVPMTSKEVMELLGISDEKLKLLIRQCGLPAYNKYTHDRVDPSSGHSTGPLRLQWLCFEYTEIQRFKTDHPELLGKGEWAPTKATHESEQREMKLRNSQRHKERCRALAQHQWEKHSEDIVTEMAEWDVIKRIGCEGKDYKRETICDWIRDLCPNPKKGRPKKD